MDIADAAWLAPSCARWVATADLIGLQRRSPDFLPLVVDQATGSDVIDAADLDFDYKLGVRASLVRDDGWGAGWELAFLGIPSMDAEVLAAGDLQMQGPGFGLAVNPGIFDVRAESSLYSGEILARRTDGCRWAAFAGFRYLRFNDNLLVSELNTPFEDALDIETENNLYGLELGGDVLLYDRGGPLRGSIQVKFGIYGNEASQRTRSSILGPAVRARDTKVAFTGEADFVLTYQVTRHVLVHGGYMLLGAGGVAQAPDQIPATDLSTGRSGVRYNSLLLDGGFLGVTCLW